jgi:flagellar protein FlaD
MVDSEGKGKKIAEEFDIGNELSILVAKGKIQKRLAEKLEKKLKEKEVKISKERLNTLIEKINNIMRTYSKFEQIEKQEQTSKDVRQLIDTKQDANMQKLVETIEKIDERLTKIEEEKVTIDEKTWKSKSPKLHTTDDIKIPEHAEKHWDLDPLDEIPSDPENIVVTMKWLQYLIDKCGWDNLGNILDYYVDIGWITQDAKISLIDYSQGITEEIKKTGTQSVNISKLPSRDHIQSFIFIQKLKGKQFDKHFIDRIDNELNMISKRLDHYNVK